MSACNTYFAGDLGGPSGARCVVDIDPREPHVHVGEWMGFILKHPWVTGYEDQSLTAYKLAHIASEERTVRKVTVE